MANLGFVGLGVMGGRIAKRLLDADHSVIGYNRTKSKADWLLKAGMRWGETPRAVAEAADITFSMVTNTEALQAVTGGPEGILAGLSGGKIYIDMSTASPAFSRDLAKQVASLSGKEIEIVLTPAETPVWGQAVDCSEARRLLDGWRPEVPLRDGLRRVYDDIAARLAEPEQRTLHGAGERGGHPAR